MGWVEEFKFTAYAGGGLWIPHRIRLQAPRRFRLRPEGRTLKDVASAASSTGGPRNRLCKVAQKPRGGG